WCTCGGVCVCVCVCMCVCVCDNRREAEHKRTGLRTRQHRSIFPGSCIRFPFKSNNSMNLKAFREGKKHICTCKHKQTHACTCTCTNMHKHAHAHTCTYTYTHTHTVTSGHTHDLLN